MVASRCVDDTIAYVPEYAWHKKREKVRNGREVLELVRYSDMPPGKERYPMCHRNFRADHLEAINKAIRHYRKDCGLKNPAPECNLRFHRASSILCIQFWRSNPFPYVESMAKTPESRRIPPNPVPEVPVATYCYKKRGC